MVKEMKILDWAEFIDMVHNPDSLDSVRWFEWQRVSPIVFLNTTVAYTK